MALKDLSATAKLLYAVLAYRQGCNEHSWAGVRRLAKDMGCSTTTIERSIDQLEKAGLVVVTRGRPDKQGLRRCGNRYAINRIRNGTVTVPEVARSNVVPTVLKTVRNRVNNGTELRKDNKNKERDTSAPTVAGASLSTLPTEQSTGRLESSSKHKANPWALWVVIWRDERPGQPDPANTGPNTRAAKELCKLIPDPSELKEIYRRYLQDKDQFLLRQGHALRLLPGRIDAYRGKPADPDDQGETFWEGREAELQASGEAEDHRQYLAKLTATTQEGGPE